MIKKLKKKQIFVFGSNLAGEHFGGAALTALDRFGAILGLGEGLQGQSYAFPTLTTRMEKVNKKSLMASRDKLFACCLDNPGKEFLMTALGTGIAGFSINKVRPLFLENRPSNLILPKEWR